MGGFENLFELRSTYMDHGLLTWIMWKVQADLLAQDNAAVQM